MRMFQKIAVVAVVALAILSNGFSLLGDDGLTDAQKAAVRKMEEQRIAAIKRVVNSVVAVYGDDRAGGGSGVIIHPSGLALTNHHVIAGAGVEGFGGIADGKLYRWKLIGTDPGGDVSLIQMQGRDDFPWAPLGDSDTVEVGDWALAMGNPFVLTEDEVPTVTLGIVNGVNRYQPGSGQNQLEYGNCIQVDSAINPGNSGGPLFNFQGEVIGINGRGSFNDRGRVNVGLGYAISSNQIRNFIPELLATKLVEHATLDAGFTQRSGKVICSSLISDSPAAQAGLKLKDELLEFEGVPIKTANQFTNLICTIPENWPVSLKVRSEDGVEKSIVVRAFGLPYPKPQQPRGRQRQPDGDPSEEEKAQLRKQQEMIKLLSADPGTVRHKKINRGYTKMLMEEWRTASITDVENKADGGWSMICAVMKTIKGELQKRGELEMTLRADGKFWLNFNLVKGAQQYVFDGESFFRLDAEGAAEKMTAQEARTTLPVLLGYGVASPLLEKAFGAFGKPLLDGSDRVAGDDSCRIKFAGKKKGSMYVWIDLHCQQWESKIGGLLRKMATKMDGDEDGGVLFLGHQSEHGLQVPMEFRFVSGLTEKAELVLNRKTFELLDAESKQLKKLDELLEEIGE